MNRIERAAVGRRRRSAAEPRPDPNPENLKFVGLLAAAPRRAIRASAAAALLSRKSNPLEVRWVPVSPSTITVVNGRRMELKEFSRNKYLRAPTTAPYHVPLDRSWEPVFR